MADKHNQPNSDDSGGSTDKPWKVDVGQPHADSEIANKENSGATPEATGPDRDEAQQSGAEADSAGGSSGSSSKSTEGGEIPNSVTPQNNKRGVRGVLTGRRRKYAAGALLGGGTVGLAMLALSSLVPLKINHIIENLEDHYNSGIEDASDKWRERVISKYIMRHVLPNLGPTCTSTIDRNCRFRTDWDERSAFGRLGAGWQDHRFELQLAEKHGIEFMREGRSSQYYQMRVRGKPNIRFNIADVRTEGDLVTVIGRRPDVRRAVREATDNLTFFKRVHARYRIGTLLERKYGIKRCRLWCDRRDGLNEWRQENITDRKKGYLVGFATHVAEPHSEVVAAALNCVMIGGCEDPDSYNSDGERRDKFQREAQDRLQQLSEAIGEKAVRELVEDADKILRNGITGHIIGKIMTKIFNEELGDQAARVASKAIPIVGWIDMAADIMRQAEHLPDLLKKARFVAASSAMIAAYVGYRSHLDEMKAGNTDAAMTGSYLSSLGSSDPESVQAEAAPVYRELIPSSPLATTDMTLGTKVYAQVGDGAGGGGGASKVYKCVDGNKVDYKKKICPEDDLNTADGVTEALEFLTQNPLMASARIASDIWYQDFLPGPPNLSLNSIWAVGDKIGDLLVNNPLARPLVNRIEGLANALFDPLMDFLSQRLIGSPFPDDPEKLAIDGAKNLTTMAGGLDSAAFAFGQYGMGGVAGSAEQVSAIRKHQEQERQVEFAALPLKQKIFDTSTRYSVVSRIAMALPSDTPTGSAKQLAASLSNPISSLSKMFSAVMAATPVGAQTGEDILECDDPSEYSGCDPFHVPQMIFPEEDMEGQDPEALTDDVCREMNEEWQGDLDETETEYRSINPENGMDLYKKSNICKLNCNVTTGLGGIYSDATITQEEHGECGVVDNESSSSPTGPVSAQCPAGINPEPHPSRDGYFKMPDAPNGEYAIYSGQAERYGSKQLVCMLYNVGIAFNTAMQGRSKLQIGDLNAGGHRSHYRGIAVDVDGAGEVRAADNTKSGYDTDATITLGKIFIDSGIIRNIWWCDAGDGSRDAIIDYANRPGGPGFEGQIKCLSGHYNHFHVDIKLEFALPGRFEP